MLFKLETRLEEKLSISVAECLLLTNLAPIGYITAKAGLEMFMKTMAVRYGKQGLRFNVVSPGNVLFEGSVWDQKLKADKMGVNSYLEQQVPLGKFITPQEIAIAVSFLASSGAQSITGIVLPIDGGQSL